MDSAKVAIGYEVDHTKGEADKQQRHPELRKDYYIRKGEKDGIKAEIDRNIHVRHLKIKRFSKKVS